MARDTGPELWSRNWVVRPFTGGSRWVVGMGNSSRTRVLWGGSCQSEGKSAVLAPRSRAPATREPGPA